MTGIQPVRGTHDLLAEDFRAHKHVIDTARQVAATYGYAEIATPIFEMTEVFARSMGETSDVVSKEMYSFIDKGDEQLTLRPENTAGICRAFISNGLQQSVPFKAFAHGPMFRYERPQKGRQRQFHQIDIEVIGAAEPEADIEVITMAADLLRNLGILEKCTLELNSLGDLESRTAYRQALVSYLERYRADLSADSQKRLERNPLRILDSKDETDRKIVSDAPTMSDYFTSSAQQFFDIVKSGLAAAGVTFQLNPKLVRGLDYYTHTAFEFVTNALGAQGTVIGGGRYDGLIEMLGGQPTPGIGWAGGIERLSMLAQGIPPAERPLTLVPIGEEAERLAQRLARELRAQGFIVELGYRGNVKKRMQRANKLNAKVAVLIGEDEIKRNIAQVKLLDSGSQDEVGLDRLAEYLSALPQ